jgi:hypothetical protein
VSLKPQQKKTLRMTAEATDAAGEGVISVEVSGRDTATTAGKKKSPSNASRS